MEFVLINLERKTKEATLSVGIKREEGVATAGKAVKQGAHGGEWRVTSDRPDLFGQLGR